MSNWSLILFKTFCPYTQKHKKFRQRIFGENQIKKLILMENITMGVAGN